MASDLKELLRLGPFEGLDLTSAGPYVKPGHAVMSSNANPSRVSGALTAEKGRVQFASFADVLSAITVVVPVTTSFGTAVGVPGYFVGGTLLAGGFAAYILIRGVRTAISNCVQFDQAVQFAQVLYTNGGQRYFLGTATVPTQMYNWQYFIGLPSPLAPPAGNISMAVAGGGTMLAGTYFYVVTQTTTMPDGTVSETSVDLNQYASPPSITIVDNQNVVLTPINGFGWAGNRTDGLPFTTNLYRMSAKVPTYLFVANIPANGAYTDTQTDAQIAANRQLQPYRDAPPVVSGSYGLNANFVNYGALAIHKGRVWVFATVQNSSTNNYPQVQLWYSNFGRPWEFNQLTQVQLLQTDVTASNPAVSQTYTNLYGNDPIALAEVGSLLATFSKRVTGAVWGDDPTTFVWRQLFNIGCVSRHAVTPCVGGCFWLSENGAYFFDGSAPQYDWEGIRGSVRQVGNTGIPVAAQQAATGAFSNMAWYLAFPTLGEAYSYDTVTGKWLSVLPYAPSATAAFAYIASDPSSDAALDVNAIIAARGALLDFWLADPNNDLGAPQTCTWSGPLTDSEQRGATKSYRFITLTAPIQPGFATVTISVDPGAPNSVAPATPYSVTFDLSGAGSLTVNGVPALDPHGLAVPDRGPRHIASIGLPNEGFIASLAVSVTGLANQPAPAVWSVSAWGDVRHALEVPV